MRTATASVVGMAGFENYPEEIRAIEQEIERRSIGLGINWDDDAQVRSLAREAGPLQL